MELWWGDTPLRYLRRYPTNRGIPAGTLYIHSEYIGGMKSAGWYHRDLIYLLLPLEGAEIYGLWRDGRVTVEGWARQFCTIDGSRWVPKVPWREVPDGSLLEGGPWDFSQIHPSPHPNANR